MLGGFVSAFRTPDLRGKIFFTLGVLALYRLGCAIPTPGVSLTNTQQCITATGDNSVLQLIQLFSGGALLQLSIFALGVMPYITASIMVQLLRTLVPRFQELHSQGADGQAKLTQYTRYITVGFAALQAASFVTLARNKVLFPGCELDIIPNDSWYKITVMVLTMTAGTVLIMWLAERITERGLGNGMSLLIFVSVASGLPSAAVTVANAKAVEFTWLWVLLTVITVLCIVVYVEQSQRRIPVQYAKRMVGRKMLGGTSTYIPIRINMAGVIPIIFASSLLSLPQLISQFAGDNPNDVVQWITANVATSGKPLYNLFYVLMILFFAYFYTAMTFNPDEVADNMKKYGGFVPGIRPGKPTAAYLDYVLSRITAFGSLYLALIALVPTLIFQQLGLGQSLAIGGSSLIIVVGVGLDTVRRIQSQLERRHYEGFLK